VNLVISLQLTLMKDFAEQPCGIRKNDIYDRTVELV